MTGAFFYATTYLEDPCSQPISRSLPLRVEPYSRGDAMPYFEGLVPEGNARALMAAELHVRADDYLSMLAACGSDCVGDLVITSGEVLPETGWEAISDEDMAAVLARPRAMTELNHASRLSLAGTQNKVGLTHVPGEALSSGWLRPLGRAASSHILKVSSKDAISYFEFLCMRAAETCRVRVARTELLGFSTPVIVSERFDRLVTYGSGELEVERLHQEDVAQAFGLVSDSKYTELEGGSIHAIAALLLHEAEDPARDLAELARLSCFNYLIGNCDNHLKNLSLLYNDDWSGFSLAPAYDLVCTTWFPEYSHDMGMALGGVHDIDAITPDDVRSLAGEIGIGARAFRRMAHELSEQIVDAVFGAAEEAPAELDEVQWKAEELVHEIEPRRLVLAAV